MGPIPKEQKHTKVINNLRVNFMFWFLLSNIYIFLVFLSPALSSSVLFNFRGVSVISRFRGTLTMSQSNHSEGWMIDSWVGGKGSKPGGLVGQSSRREVSLDSLRLSSGYFLHHYDAWQKTSPSLGMSRDFAVKNHINYNSIAGSIRPTTYLEWPGTIFTTLD